MNTERVSRSARVVLVVALLLGLLLLAAPAMAGTLYPPIADGPPTFLPDFIGTQAVPQPVSLTVPQNPFLAPNPYSGLHNDSWNTDVYSVWAPLGIDPRVYSSTLNTTLTAGGQMTTAMGVDTYGRLVIIKIAITGTQLLVVDPETLEVLSSQQIGEGGRKAIGSAYWYLDRQDRVTVVSGRDKILTMQPVGTLAHPSYEVMPSRVFDLSLLDESPVLADDKLNGLMPDWKGRIWFQTQGNSTATEPVAPRVGVIVPSAWPNRVKWIELRRGEEIWNGMAVTKGATYVLTSQRLLRLEVARSGRPHIVWSARYETIGTTRSGQYSLGSGTSPTIIGGGRYVAIADNAQQIHMLVFRTAARLGHGQKRLVGSLPLFTGQAGGAVENSLLGAGTSIIAENNYGYAWRFSPEGAIITTCNVPGIERVDVRPHGKGLTKVWENTEIAAMSTPKLSTKTGLVYLLARTLDATTSADVFYWTALDYRTGAVVWQKMAGTGMPYDNYWASPVVGRSGAIFIGSYGGLAAIQDSAPTD